MKIHVVPLQRSLELYKNSMIGESLNFFMAIWYVVHSSQWRGPLPDGWGWLQVFYGTTNWLHARLKLVALHYQPGITNLHITIRFINDLDVAFYAGA